MTPDEFIQQARDFPANLARAWSDLQSWIVALDPLWQAWSQSEGLQMLTVFAGLMLFGWIGSLCAKVEASHTSYAADTGADRGECAPPATGDRGAARRWALWRRVGELRRGAEGLQDTRRGGVLSWPVAGQPGDAAPDGAGAYASASAEAALQARPRPGLIGHGARSRHAERVKGGRLAALVVSGSMSGGAWKLAVVGGRFVRREGDELGGTDGEVEPDREEDFAGVAAVVYAARRAPARSLSFRRCPLRRDGGPRHQLTQSAA